MVSQQSIELELQLASEIRIDKNGIGTMSIRGSARVAGIAENSLRYAFKGAQQVRNKPRSEPSQTQSQQGFWGAQQKLGLNELLTQQGFNPTTFSKEGVPDVAVALIVKYYAYFAGVNCNDRSRQMDFVFGSIGSRVWMQDLTGWTKTGHQAKASLAEGLMLRDAAPWEQLIGKRFIVEACRITGWQWQWRVMGKFLKKYIYDRCGTEIQTYLDEVNPSNDKGHRSSKNHQHFNPEARDMLQEHVKVLETLMSVSINQAMFDKIVEAKFGGTQQMTVFDI